LIQGSRRSRILSGISANLFAQAANVGIQIIGIPVLLHYWGVAYYGEWLLLFSIPSYLGMSDLGLGTVATTEVSMAVARGNYELALRIFRGAFFSIISFGLIACALFSASVWILPFHQWLNLKQIGVNELNLTFSFLIVYVFGTIFLSLPLGMYRSIGHYGRGQIVSTGFRIAEFLGLLALVMTGSGVMLVSAAYAAIRLCFICFVWFDIRRKATWLKINRYSYEWPIIRPLFIPSFSMFISNMGQTLVTQGIVTIIGIKLGSVQLVLFSTVRTLCNFSKQMIGIVNLSLFSEFSISKGQKDLETSRRLHIRSVQANIGLTLISVIGLKVLGPWILSIWTKGVVTDPGFFFSLYLVYLLINSFWFGSWNMLLGCNQHFKVTLHYITLSLLSLIAIYLFAPGNGLEIIPVILIISDLIFLFFVMRESMKVLSDKYSNFWPKVFHI
jgi:O-antigen/teichoic acid export membrane protein